MAPKEYERFNTLLDDPGKIVSVETLGEIIGWLIEEYSNRPNQQPRGLTLWAVDLWPYVNGKALVNGLRLEEMELSDMLDVIHYFYEEDLNYASVEQAQMTDARRVTLFKQLYGIDY